MIPRAWFLVAGLVLGVITIHAIYQGTEDRRWRRFVAERDSLKGVSAEYDRQRARFAADNHRLLQAISAANETARHAEAKAIDANRSVSRLRATLATIRPTIDTVAIVVTQDSLITELTAETSHLRSALASQIEANVALSALHGSLVRQLAIDSAEIGGLRSLVSRAPAPSSRKLFGLIKLPSCGPGVAFGTDLTARPALACVVPL